MKLRSLEREANDLCEAGEWRQRSDRVRQSGGARRPQRFATSRPLLLRRWSPRRAPRVCCHRRIVVIGERQQRVVRFAMLLQKWIVPVFIHASPVSV